MRKKNNREQPKKKGWLALILSFIGIKYLIDKKNLRDKK